MNIAVSTNRTETQDLSRTIFSGTHGQYYWLTSTEQYIGHLVQLCPDLFVGHYLTVTAIDSGLPWLTDAQAAAGWSLRSGMAYSERISSLDELSYQHDGKDYPGYDEWYVFSGPSPDLGETLNGNPFSEGNEPQPGRLLVFVGWGAFVLHDPAPDMQLINEMFWRQLDWIQPDAYVSDGRDHLTFVCKDEAVFESVHRRLRAAQTTAEQ